MLQQLSDKIKEKLPHLIKKKVFFYQDNAPSTSLRLQWPIANLQELGFELVFHLLYSPDVMFSNMKKLIDGKIFLSDSEVISAEYVERGEDYSEK